MHAQVFFAHEKTVTHRNHLKQGHTLVAVDPCTEPRHEELSPFHTLVLLWPCLNLGTYNVTISHVVLNRFGRALDDENLLILCWLLTKTCPIVMPLVGPGLSRLKGHKL